MRQHVVHSTVFAKPRVSEVKAIQHSTWFALALKRLGITSLFLILGLATTNAFAMSGKSFVFSPKHHTWYAINADGKVIKQGRASGGKGYCPDIRRSCRTPTGTYYVHYKGGSGCRSSRYPVGRGGSPMPYCMFFSKYYAVHGSYDVPNHNASHGCIRVRPSDARWLYHNFMDVGTRVVVKSY